MPEHDQRGWGVPKSWVAATSPPSDLDGALRHVQTVERVAYTPQASDQLWLGKILWRRWRLIVLVFVLGTGAVAGLLQVRTPQYTASTEILVERDETEFSNLRHEAQFRWRTVEPAEMETLARVLGSDRVALEVIDRLRLRGQSATPASDEDSVSEAAVLDRFRRQVEITRDPLAFVITVSYTHSDAAIAAEVANTIAQVFLEELVRAQRAELTQSADYLRDRVSSLAHELEAAQSRVSGFQNERRLYRLEESTADELRYAELTRQLLAAEADLARARAQEAQIAGGRAGASQNIESLASPVITALRTQEAEVARRLADLSSTYGERHPRMIDTAAELEEVRRNIASEQARIVAQVRSEVQVMADRVASLRAEIERTEQKLGDNAGAAAELDALDSRVSTTQRTYEDLLERYQLASEQQHLLRAPARVITPARPSEHPNRKTTFLILGFASFSFLTGGMGLALLLELLRRGYEAADELERELGVAVLATLPLVRQRHRKDMAPPPDSETAELQEIIYAEALQRLFVRVTGADGGGGRKKVWLVTSSLPNEGKSTVTFSLARQVAASGVRVLLISADLRKQRSSPQIGLVKVLSGEVPNFMAAVKHYGEHSNLDMLIADASDPHPQRLLGSPAMAQLLDEARRFYDLVLIDTPPLLAFSDCAVLIPIIDQLLFVVRWQATSRQAVKVALKELAAHGAPLAGSVLNQVDLAVYSRHTKSDPLSYYQSTNRYYSGHTQRPNVRRSRRR